MVFVIATSIRELSRNASRVIDRVIRTGRPTLVTRRGTPVAAVVPLDAGDVEDLVLARTPEYLADMAAADDDVAARRGQFVDEVLAGIDAEEHRSPDV
jgi:prevent-host-death family protein